MMMLMFILTTLHSTQNLFLAQNNKYICLIFKILVALWNHKGVRDGTAVGPCKNASVLYHLCPLRLSFIYCIIISQFLSIHLLFVI